MSNRRLTLGSRDGRPAAQAYNEHMGFLGDLGSRWKDVGFEKLRRALVLLSLSFFAVLYFLVGINPEVGPLARVFLAWSACYGVAFVALASEWFWARWFATGLGWFGLMVGAFTIAQAGLLRPIVVFTTLHGIVVLGLAGAKMAALYDYQEGWRTRWGMDEFGVARLRKTVTRAAASLPAVLIWALLPSQESWVVALLAVAGLAAVIRGRTWGLLALGAASVAVSAIGPHGFPCGAHLPFGLQPLAGLPASVGPSLAAVLLAFAVLPFVRPAVAFLRDRRDAR